jgi:hypothetical protein
MTKTSIAIPTRALSVIRRVEHPNGFYEAWLHHAPDINSNSFGIRLTKNLLQLAADHSDKFPTDVILPDDIEAALGTEGDEVMVFYITRGAGGSLEYMQDDPYFRIPQGREKFNPTIEPPVLPLRPAPARPPLPPLAMPPRAYTGDEIEYLAFLDTEYRKMVATMVVPGMDRIFTPDGQLSYPNPKFGKLQYEKIAEDFAEICGQAAMTFNKRSGGGDSGSDPLSFGGNS